jgi:hypothetical protein
MPIADMAYVRSRRSNIWRVIHRSSPALVCSGSFGILLIAAVRQKGFTRIGKIQDRMACVSRGEMRAGDIVHRIAAAEAYDAAHKRSRGDVAGRDLANAVSGVLASHYHAFATEPLAVESVIVQINATPDQDSLLYVGPDGSIRPFEHILYLRTPPPPVGALMAGRGDRHRDNRRGSKTQQAEEALERLNDRLREAYTDEPTASDAIIMLRRMPDLQPLLSADARRDAVLLDRSALQRHAYGDVFRRLQV